MTDMTTEYAAKVLEVDPASVVEDELRERYRALLKLHHPDLGPESERHGREAITVKVNAAYRWLLVHIERREEQRRDAETTRLFTEAGWTYEPVAPDWFPSEPPPGGGPEWVPLSKRKPKKSRPTHRAITWPSAGRQRGVILLVGAVALLSGAHWYDSLALMLTAAILGSILIGRPMAVLSDMFALFERWVTKKR